ncbi:PREDICTED: probable folate-biopterin transporter 2 isoform X2 [Nicotiana attenuata]|uniref:probable folate-biopterin transporter 2 isoform X2 n=1 Tax=Nicotiana attenuata TaxID=49451 RepID=UPI000905B613|nr:PREDICTED: probable folate-biopterin transporter 2 isoform X2 [Nicotiana attenuata]
MGEESKLQIHSEEEVEESEHNDRICCSSMLCGPINWFKMLAVELHWSFVFGVVIVYGVSQGLGGAFSMIGTEYYMKDVQKVQPSESQVYSGITSIPWIVKPLWGLLTDVVPILGYRRRPYFVFAGSLGVVSMLFLSLHKNLHIVFALLSLTAGSAGVAIADVTVDACVAQNSGSHPSLAADMQSLCSLSSSIGALVGFSLSGTLVHLLGPMGVYGLLSIPAVLVFLVGVLLKEPQTYNFAYQQESIGYISAVGSAGSLLVTILYQYGLKDYCFRDLLFWTQLLLGLSGMLDLLLVLRLNLKFGIPDYFFVAIDASVSQMIGRLKWMPLLVLSSKLCPPGIEGTFFALLMSIDNAGLLTSRWGGGFLLHVFKVTRTQFDNLWLAILIRNILRIAPLFVLFLVPKSDPNSSILPDEVSDSKENIETPATENENIELVALVHNMDSR